MEILSWQAESPQQVQSALNDVVIVQEDISPYVDDCRAQYASTTTGEVYQTSLSKCTCIGYQVRRTPCKHMLRLAIDANFLDAKGAAVIPPQDKEPTTANIRKSSAKPKTKSAEPRKQKKSCLPLVNLRTHQALIEEVTKRNIKYVDCFDKGGSFWLEYTNDAALFVAKYTFKRQFALRIAHSRHFKEKPAWFFNPVDL